MSRKLVYLCIVVGLCLAPVAQAAKIIWVSDGYDERPDGQADDYAAVDFLASLGHTVEYQRAGFGNGSYRTLDAARITALNAADLVIVGRSVDSGQYATDATEVSQWNGIKAPLILMTPYISRMNRWTWYNNDTLSEDGGTPTLVAVDPHHPIFKGVALDAKGQVDIYDQSIGSGTVSFAGVLVQGNGTLLAQAISGTRTMIAEWAAGKPFYAGGAQTPAGKRMLFCAGTREGAGFGRGEFNLNAEGKKLFTNAIDYMTGKLVREPWVKAWKPDPADGAVNITMPLLRWTAGETAVLHNVYLGATPELTQADLFAPNNSLAMAFYTGVLTSGTKYYWRVDEVDVAGQVHTGDVWSFSTASLVAFEPRPRDGAKWVDPASVELQWQPGQNALSHEIYFGADLAAVTAGDAATFKGKEFATLLSVGQLAANTVYYWRVDEILLDGTKRTGNVWSFTTLAPGGGIRGLYYGNAALDGQPAFSQIDPQINFNWAAEAPLGLPVDSFSIRWVGELEIPFSETYTFYPTTDDGVRLWVNNVQLLNLWTNRRAGTEAKASIELAGGQRVPIVMEFYNAEGNAIAELRWESPSIPKNLIPQAAFSAPLRASGPYPANGASNVPQDALLTWSAGEKTRTHHVYFGEDRDAVAAATPASAGVYRGAQPKDKATFDPGSLEWNKTYFWRIDEVNDADPASPWVGSVWSFTTADFLVVDDMEIYTVDEGNRIYESWFDGYADQSSGSIVGYLDPPFVERKIVHGGSQSMPLDYNNVKPPYYSEAEREFSPQQNWTVNGVTDLVLHVRGNPIAYAETAPGAFTMSAAGVDIWNTADEFRFAFQRLSGNGSIVAKVESIGNTNVWAKAGVMIRESLDPSSSFAYMVGTPGSGVSFGWRQTFAGTPASANTADIVTPQWVKLTRTGSTFTAQYSADGKAWTDVKNADGTVASTTITMTGTVYIGLCVTSHSAGVVTTGQFSGVAATGGTGAWQMAEIGIDHPGNSQDDLYVRLEDSTGKSATVKHPDPAAVNSADWIEWRIPLSSFTGVNASRIKKMFIGVGDRAAPSPDGSGLIYIDDIRVVRP